MMNNLDLMIALHDISYPAPTKEQFQEFEFEPDGTTYVIHYRAEAHQDALDEWSETRERQITYLRELAEDDALPSDGDDAVAKALIEATKAAQRAEDTRSQLLGIAVHETGLSVRRIAALTGMHPNTVTKRASEDVALNALIALKKAELNALMAKSNAEES